jgi:hypothetical protein
MYILKYSIFESSSLARFSSDYLFSISSAYVTIAHLDKGKGKKVASEYPGQGSREITLSVVAESTPILAYSRAPVPFP